MDSSAPVKAPYVSPYFDPFGDDLPPVDSYASDMNGGVGGYGDEPGGGRRFDPESEAAYQAREEERQREREALYARLNPRQAEAVNLPDVSALVLAGAGSGKTSVLTARVAKLATGSVAPRSILAVTFTNKAAGEMKERLRKLLDKKSVNELWMGTFHSLCSKLLRENFEAAGLPKSFAILDTDGQEAICRGILKDFGLTKASVKEAAKARAAATASLDLLSAADPLAAAGALSADDVEDDGEANEFVTPSQCAKYISSRKEALKAPEPPSSISVRSTDVDQMEAVYAEYQQRCAKSGLLDFQDLLTKGVELLRTNEEVRSKYRDRFKAILVDEFQDTNDIQYEWLQLLKSPQAFVMAVGDDSQSIYGFRGANPANMKRFVDEMTVDKQAPQGRIVRLEQNYRSLPHILEAANAIIDRNPNQLKKTLFTAQPDRGEKIDLVTYSNGMFEASSIARSIHRMVKEQGVPPAEVAVLYRTNQQSRLIEQELNKLGIPLVVYGGYRFYDRQEIKVVMAYLDLVCDMTRDLSFARVANVPPRGIGERTIEELRQQAKLKGISMMEMVGERSSQLAVNANALGNAAAVKKQRQLEGFTTVILELAEKAGELPLSKLIEHMLTSAGLDAYYRAEGGNSKAGQAEAEERLKNIGELMSAAKQFELENPELTTASDQLPEYLAYVALMTSTSESDMTRKNTVSLMTVHSSKGLEFDHVFLSGMEEQTFPHSRAIKEDEENGNGKSIDAALREMGAEMDDDGNLIVTDAESDHVDGEGMQEERRLMYVAVTRARKTLTLSHALERMNNGEVQTCEPSRFLEEIPAKRLRRIDDAKQGRKSGWGRSSGNREYGGDAYDAGRTEFEPLPERKPAARPELRTQACFATEDLASPAEAAAGAVGAGSIRVVSKRRGGVAESSDETVIDVDRSHPSLGNRHFLNDHNDADERARVIDAYRADFERDMAARGPMFRAVSELAERVAGGERIALRCWCAPRDCHGDIVRDKVLEIARVKLSTPADNAVSRARQASEAKKAGVAPADRPSRTMAIIGTAGRDKDRPMNLALWQAMLADAKRRVKPTDTLVSGGAAWADHLAVRLYLDGDVKHLVLHLPAPLQGGSFAGPERESAGSAANYYHGLFKRNTGVDGLAEIAQAIAKGAKVTEQPAARGYGAMYARNALVAKTSDVILAYTFGDGDVPADGGTKNTWDEAKSAQRLHVPLTSLSPAHTAAPALAAAQQPAPAQSGAAKPWQQRAWQRSAAPVTAPPSGRPSQPTVPSEETRSRLAMMGRRPMAPRPR